MAIEGDNPLKLTLINDLFQYNETHKLEVNFEYDDEESKEGQLTVKQVTLTVQAIVNSAVLDGEIQVRLNAQVGKLQKVLPLNLDKTLVENPDEDIKIRACLQSSNKKIFDLIQNVQKETIEQRKQSFESLKVLDKDLDQFMETVQKIKNREVKREMMSQILDCKVKVAKVIEVLRTCQTQQITNIQIAQLNDCAYKAIRKVGVQKKLDERALKNEAIFKNLEKKLT